MRTTVVYFRRKRIFEVSSFSSTGAAVVGGYSRHRLLCNADKAFGNRAIILTGLAVLFCRRTVSRLKVPFPLGRSPAIFHSSRLFRPATVRVLYSWSIPSTRLIPRPPHGAARPPHCTVLPAVAQDEICGGVGILSRGCREQSAESIRQASSCRLIKWL